MLQLSDNAAAALESIRQNQEIPEDHGTRLTGEREPTGDLALRLEFVESAPDDHEVTEQAGTEVYIDPVVAEPLAEVVLDVQDSDEGLAFVFRPQSD